MTMQQVYEPFRTPYVRKVLGMNDLVAMYPLSETGKNVVYDCTNNAYHGTSVSLLRNNPYRSVRAPDGGRTAYFDSTAYIDISAVSPSSCGTEGAISIWAALSEDKLSSSSRCELVRVSSDTANSISIYFDTTAYQFSADYFAGGTYSTVVFPEKVYNNPYSRYWEKFHHFAFTWSATDDQAIAYLNGSPSTAASSLGSFTGTFSSSGTIVGAHQNGLASPWKGFASCLSIFSAAKTQDEILKLYRLP